MGCVNSKVDQAPDWMTEHRPIPPPEHTYIPPEPVEQWATSKLEIETFSFHWSIENYSARSSDWIMSDPFKGGPKGGHTWQLKMCPKNKIEGTEYLSVRLILTGFGDGDTTVGQKVNARFQISLLDTDLRPLIKQGGLTMPVCEFNKGKEWTYDKFLKSAQEDVTDLFRLCLIADTLTIHCRVWAQVDPQHRVGQNKKSINPDGVKRRGYEGLSSNLQELLGDSEFADLALSTPTRTFMVHKAILGARSSVFRAMLNANMLESAMNTIEIPDFEEDVVKAMLEYIYTGETADLNEKAADLIQISDKYDLRGLKGECSLALVRNLTVDNAVDMLVLAHLHNAVALKGKVMDFIKRNKKDVKDTRSFNNLANSAVLKDLFLSQ